MTAKTKTTTTRRPETRATMMRAVSAMLQRLEDWAVKTKADLHNPERGRRARAAAFAEILALCEQAAGGELQTLWNPEEAERWIDAALAAGISFERHVSRNKETGGSEITYKMHHGSDGSGRVAAAFSLARSYGPELMDKALARRFEARDTESRMAVTCDLDGDWRSNDRTHVLAETRSELALTRAKQKAAHYMAAYFGDRS